MPAGAPQPDLKGVTLSPGQFLLRKVRFFRTRKKLMENPLRGLVSCPAVCGRRLGVCREEPGQQALGFPWPARRASGSTLPGSLDRCTGELTWNLSCLDT